MTALLSFLAILALPGVAIAGPNAAEEEYKLDIPGPGGGQEGTDSGTGTPTGESPLPPGTESALEEQGDDGAAAAEFAKGTAPKDGAGNQGGSDDAQPSGGADADDSGVADVVADLASGSDSGMGPILPIVLGLAVVGALIIVFRRRGRDSAPGA